MDASDKSASLGSSRPSNAEFTNLSTSSWIRLHLTRPQFFLPFEDHQTLSQPVDPAVSWIGPTTLPVGIHPSLRLPDYVNFKKKRVGRVFHWTPVNQHTRTIAFFPADCDDPNVPPCPGFEPDGFDLWANPSTTFTDGSLGRWDFRYYPQLYKPTRPWLAFSIIPLYMHPECPMELRRVPEFWTWNDPRNSARGGYWNHVMLSEAFQRREEIEEEFYQAYTKKRWFELDHGKFTLPPYDPLRREDALKWRSWREGRDALSRMLLYMAELKTFVSWITNAFVYLGRSDNSPPPAVPAQCFMGAWAQTIASTEEWDSLAFGGAPIYIAAEVPPNHPLHSVAQPGAPDADERYRQNAFDFSLGRLGARNVIKIWRFPPSALEYAEGLVFPSELLPSALTTPVSGYPGKISTTWHMFWDSYIYQDPAVFRGFIPMTTEESRMRRLERSSFAVLYPTQRIMTCSLDPHPLLSVLPASRDQGITYFLESTDGDQRFWPMKVPGWVQSRYRFEYPQERIIIQSSRPFPGRPRSIGRISADICIYEDHDKDKSLPDRCPRKYFPACPAGSTDEPALTWLPEANGGFDVVSTTKELSRPTPYPVPMRNQGIAPGCGSSLPAPRTLPAVLIDSYAPRSTTIADVLGLGMQESQDCEEEDDMVDVSNESFDLDESSYEPRDHSVDVPNLIMVLASQKEEMERESRRRFFKREWEDWVADELVPGWMAKDGNMVYYALRICNWDGDTRFDTVIALLEKVVGVRELLCIGMHNEADGTQTSDIGFQFAEDALLVWSALLHVRAGERILEVYPLKAIPSLFYISTAIFQSERPCEQRIGIIRHLILRERILNRYEAHEYALSRGILSLARSLISSENEIQSLTALPLGDVCGDSLLPPLISKVNVALTKIKFPFKIKWTNGVHAPTSMERITNLLPYQVGPVTLPSQEQVVHKPETDVRDRHAAKSTNPRKKRQKVSCSSDAEDPGSLQNLLSKERYKLKRAILGRIHLLSSRWKGLELPAFDQSTVQGKDLVTFFLRIWEWKDTCRARGVEFRDSAARDLDFGPFENEFGDFGNLHGIYGNEYRDIVAALAQYKARIAV
jgi:hypothetical protein